MHQHGFHKHLWSPQVVVKITWMHCVLSFMLAVFKGLQYASHEILTVPYMPVMDIVTVLFMPMIQPVHIPGASRFCMSMQTGMLGSIPYNKANRVRCQHYRTCLYW